MNQEDNELSQTLVPLTDFDNWTAGDACEGTLITGSPGSGKSSTSAKEIAYSFLKAGYGGLVLCAKSSEPEIWLKYCQECGRGDDVILFSEGSGQMYDPLFYEWNRPGKGAGDVEGMVEMLTMLTGGSESSEKFWEGGNKKLMRHSIKVLGLAKEPISVFSMNEVITNLPHQAGEANSEGFQKTYVGKLFARIRERGRTEGMTKGEWKDFVHAQSFLLDKWPALARETASSIEAHWDVLADQLLFEPFNTLFCSGQCTVLPEHSTHAGKVVIVAFPILQYGETGVLINKMMKVSFQKAWLRRDVKQHPRPAFLFQDEFQRFLCVDSKGAGWDNAFQQVAREYRIANVCITQNILNLSEALGEQHLGSKSKSFLGNLKLRIMHQQNCVDTNQYCADLIGKRWAPLENKNYHHNQDANVSVHYQLMHYVEPTAFSFLQQPDSNNPDATAIVWQGGKAFEGTSIYADAGTSTTIRPKHYILRRFSR